MRKFNRFNIRKVTRIQRKQIPEYLLYYHQQVQLKKEIKKWFSTFENVSIFLVKDMVEELTILLWELHHLKHASLVGGTEGDQKEFQHHLLLYQTEFCTVRKELILSFLS